MTGKASDAPVWDAGLLDLPLSDIDADAVSAFAKQAAEAGRLASFPSTVEETLTEIGLIRKGRLTRAAALCFGKDPSSLGVNFAIRIGRVSPASQMRDDKWARGTLFEQFHAGLALIKGHLSVTYRIEGTARTEIWEYPLVALREALLNAICHRDYSDAANFIQVTIADDMLWCANPGKLPSGIRISDLKKPHRSCLRNPLIAKTLYFAGLVEQFGSGTLRMVEAMRNAGLPDPEFREEMGGFSVYLYKDRYTPETLRSLKLSQRQMQAVMYAKERGRVTNKEYQNLNGVSNKTAYLELKELVQKGVMRIEGKGRTLQYILK